MVLSPMKKILLIVALLPINIFSQIYTPDNFNLKGDVHKVSVVCHDIETENGEVLEGFPYSSQMKFHTDLNLHYLEFDSEGRLNRSRLYYPRDFYGQFQWMVPQFNLEESDFGPKKNYLGMDYRYKYKIGVEGNTRIQVFNSTNSFYIVIDNKNRLVEDEYYTYTYNDSEGISKILKRRKGSQYDFRRIESELKDNRVVTKEFINNNFPQSKRVVISEESHNSEIFISLGRITAFKESLENGLVLEKHSLDLSWRNRINPWPEVEFDENLDFNSFLDTIPRDFKSYKAVYEYSDGRVIKELRYEVSGKREKHIGTYVYIHSNEVISGIIYTEDPLGEAVKKYKEFTYDDKGNWTQKVLGRIIFDKDDKEVRIPSKRYIRTLTYY